MVPKITSTEQRTDERYCELQPVAFTYAASTPSDSEYMFRRYELASSIEPPTIVALRCATSLESNEADVYYK